MTGRGFRVSQPGAVESSDVTSSTAARAPRHIVWDWNGTLLDDNDAVVSAVNAVCTAFGREHIDIEQWRAVYSRPLLRCYERLLDRELGEQDWARVDKFYHEEYRNLLHSVGLATGVPEVLRQWQRAGNTQSLLSMWFHDELRPLVAEHGLEPLFSRVDGLRDEVGGGSKDVHLRRHLDELGWEPAEVALVGDVVDDARAAEQVGADCVLVTTGVMSRPALQESGFPVVDSVSEAVEHLRART